MVLAIIAAFVGSATTNLNAFRLLCAAVVLVAIGVLVGAGSLTVR
jgi:hypothetical protein